MRPEKKAIVAEVQSYIEGSEYVVVTDCRGLAVQKMGDLRDRLRESKSELHIVKNTFLARAAEAAGLEGVGTMLEGPTAIVTGTGELTDVAKLLLKFIKENEKPGIKGGVVSQSVLSAADVEQMAKIPPREVLLGTLVGTVAAPMTRLVGVMNQKVASLLYVLKAIETKKAEGGE